MLSHLHLYKHFILPNVTQAKQSAFRERSFQYGTKSLYILYQQHAEVCAALSVYQELVVEGSEVRAAVSI